MALPRVQRDGKDLRIYENEDDLSIDLAEYVAELSEAALKERAFFTIALSGGSLMSVLGKLCQPPYNMLVEWEKWQIFWADERVVAKTHVDSNYKLTKQMFLSKVAFIPGHVHSINDSLSAEEAAEEYEYMIRQLVRFRTVSASQISDCPKFDLILLGMGSDGHVASLFPNHPVLDEKEKWVTYIIDSPEPPPERITFSLPVINSSANVAVVATGSSKAEAVHLAIDSVGSECRSLPAKMIQPSNGKLVWFLDKPAAAKLDACSQFSE